MRKGGWVGSLLGILVVALFIPACATERDAILNRQNRDAGEYVERTSTQPEVAAAGKDVKLNSETLERNVFEPPKNPIPYSPANSDKARKDSDESHTDPWYMMLLKVGGSAALGWLMRGGFLRLLAVAAPGAAAGPVGVGLSLLVEGISRVREKMNEPGNEGKVTEAQLLGILSDIQSQDPKAKALIEDLAHKIEAKLALRI